MKKKHNWKSENYKSSKLKIEDLIKDPKSIIQNLTEMNELVNNINKVNNIENFNIESIIQWKDIILKLLPKNISDENLLMVKNKINDILFNWRENDPNKN